MKHFKKLGAAVLALSLFGGSLVFTSAAYAADEAIAAAPAEATLEVAPSAEPTPKPTSSEESKGSEDATKDSSESDSTDSKTEDTSSNVEEPAPAPVVEPEPEQLPDVIVQEPSTPTPDAELTEDTDVAKTPVADPPLPEAAPAPSTAPAPSAPPAVEAPSAPTQPKVAPSGETFVILTSGPDQTIRSDGKVTIAFNYDLRPNTEREGISPLLDVYVDSAAGERTWFGDQLTAVDGPATFNHSVTLKPGTYTRYMMSTYLEYCDCLPIKDIVAPYTFIVPELVTPTWPVQEGNVIPITPQPGYAYTDTDGNVLTGNVPIPEGGLTLIRKPNENTVFPEGTDTEKTYEYIPPAPIEVTPVFPKQEPGSNVIPFTPQPGVIFTDPDGNVIKDSYTVTPGKETVYAAPDLDKNYVFSKDAQPEKKYKHYDTAQQPIDVSAPTQDGNTVIVKPAPEGSEYYNVDTGETVPGDVDLLETGPITIDARPTGDRPVKTDGPWPYYPVPIMVTPTWPVQEGNTVPFDHQDCVIFVDREGNFLIGNVTVPEDGLDVIRYPEMGCEFPEGTEPSKTYGYIPPAPTGNGGDNSSSGNGHGNNGSGGNTNNSSHKDELAVTGSQPVEALTVYGLLLLLAGGFVVVRRARHQQ